MLAMGPDPPSGSASCRSLLGKIGIATAMLIAVFYVLAKCSLYRERLFIEVKTTKLGGMSVCSAQFYKINTQTHENS
jgi:hypothetical protein